MGAFGERLRREREMRGIALEEIAAATKIGARSLKALEEERFDQLPGGIFNKGFVRAYAKFLGIDEEQAVSEYVSAAGDGGPADDVMEKLAAALGSNGNRRIMGGEEIILAEPRSSWQVIAVVALIGVVLFAVWNLYSGRKSARTGNPQAASRSISPVADASSAAALPASAVSASDSTPVQIVIRGKQDSWVSITADDKPLVQETLNASAQRSIGAANRVVLRLGNAAGVEVWYNGRLLPPLGKPGETRTVTFTTTGYE